MKVRRSFRSAPAQKQASLEDARIRALVVAAAPFASGDVSAWMSSIWVESSDKSCFEIALRDLGRLRERILMLPP